MLSLPIGGGDVDLSDLRLDICITKNIHYGKKYWKLLVGTLNLICLDWEISVT